MKIVHVVEPFASGVMTFVKSLVENLPGDHHIIIHGERKEEMPASSAKKLFPKENARFIRWKHAQRSISPLKDFAALITLYTILKRIKKLQPVDAVHLHSSKSGLLGRIACRLAGISNVIYTPNGAPFLMQENVFKKRLYERLEKISASFGGKVVCVSASEAAAYRELGITVSYINNGTSLQYGEGITKELNQGEKFVIAFTGRITTQKNPARFNKIASKFIDHQHVQFVWIGDGEKRHQLKAKNIRITGWLSEHEVKKELSKASLYLSSSDYEGLSFGVLEAMALSKPLILSDCTGNKDIIRFGVNGDLFTTVEQAYTQILYYINNKPMLEAMGGYSKDLCSKEFNAASSAGNYRLAYTC